MNTVAGRHSPVYRQVEAYEETWKKDHETVREFCGWEDTIAVGMSTGLLLERVDRAWRDRVFRETEEYCDEANEAYCTLFTDWLRVTDAVLARVAELESRCAQVDNVEELRQLAGRVREYLARWDKPRLSMAVGLREQRLAPEAAADLNRILNEGPPPPPLPPQPPLQAMSAEEFRRRFPKRGE